MAAPRTRTRRPAPVSESLQGLGERLRRGRAEAGLSQTQLGAPHFTRSYISAIELGKVRPAMKSLAFLAAKLGKPVSFFATDEAEETRRKERESVLARASQLIAEGRAAEAVANLEPVLEKSRTPHERAVSLRYLGRAYWEMNNGARAAVCLTEALRLYRSTGDEEGTIRAQAQLGMALHLLMSYAEAAVHLEQALTAIASGRVRDPLLKVHVLHNLGLTFYQRRDFATALQYFERAELEGADIGDPKWLASLLAAVGMTHHELGEYETAVAYLQRSETLFESIRNRSRAAEIRFQRARSLRALGHRTHGRSVLQEALRAAQQAANRHLETRVRMNVAWAASEDGESELAYQLIEQCVRDADDIGDLYLRFVTKLFAGRIWKAADPERAETFLRQSIGLFPESEQPPDLAESYAELSQVLAKRGRAEEAVRYAARAVGFVGSRKQ